MSKGNVVPVGDIWQGIEGLNGPRKDRIGLVIETGDPVSLFRRNHLPVGFELGRKWRKGIDLI